MAGRYVNASNYAIGFSSAMVGLVAIEPCLPVSSLRLCMEPDLDVDTLVCKIIFNSTSFIAIAHKYAI